VCVDGICCESACTGTCEACSAQGKCEAITGAPKKGKCDGDAMGPCAGSCDGKERAKCTYPTVECKAPACAGGSATPAVACSAGTCPAAPAPKTCSLGCFQDGCLDIVQIAAGSAHVCALISDGKVRCWGENSLGSTGQGGNTGSTPIQQPTEVSGLTGVKQIASNTEASCALMSDATVKCWGGNNYGSLGRGGSSDATPHGDPAAVTGITGATFIRGSSVGHFCAIVAGGAIKCWGRNDLGQLGDGKTGSFAVTTPVDVCDIGSSSTPCATTASGATFVVGGDDFTCAIFAQDKVACWGSNAAKQLGRVTSSTQNLYPGFVTPELKAKYVTAGNSIACAQDTMGIAKCWGSESLGTLGNGQDSGQQVNPVAVCTKADCTTSLTGVTGISSFDESTCAIANGAVKCWGTNTAGQLGDGTATAKQNYAASTTISMGARYLTSGGQAHLAIVDDGVNHDVKCWGGEGENMCGTNTTPMDRPTPVSPSW